MKLLHEPFWIISLKKIRLWKDQGIRDAKMYYTTYHLIKIWFLVNLKYFKEMYLKHCDNSKKVFFGHILGVDLICLRCKKSVCHINLERRLNTTITLEEMELFYKKLSENCYLTSKDARSILLDMRGVK